uniref:Ferritin n=1 Tax=Cyanistes caeruleus TaxID=156563 RepID=A0A8C0UF93_CYACU
HSGAQGLWRLSLSLSSLSLSLCRSCQSRAAAAAPARPRKQRGRSVTRGPRNERVFWVIHRGSLAWGKGTGTGNANSFGSHVALPNISKFFLHQALEERKAAEALMKYQQERGGHYCSKTIQVLGLMKALELAMVQWKTMLRYFEELYALSVENADPHSASTIKKQFIGPKIRKIKLMGDLLTNARRLDCSQDGRNSLGDYFMDRLGNKKMC